MASLDRVSRLATALAALVAAFCLLAVAAPAAPAEDLSSELESKESQLEETQHRKGVLTTTISRYARQIERLSGEVATIRVEETATRARLAATHQRIAARPQIIVAGPGILPHRALGTGLRRTRPVAGAVVATLALTLHNGLQLGELELQALDLPGEIAHLLLEIFDAQRQPRRLGVLRKTRAAH